MIRFVANNADVFMDTGGLGEGKRRGNSNKYANIVFANQHTK